MDADMVIGLGCVVLLVVSFVVVLRTRRVWVRRTAAVGMLAGWNGIAQFLLAPVVPTRVLAFVLLGGIVVAILAAAVVGTRRTRQK